MEIGKILFTTNVLKSTPLHKVHIFQEYFEIDYCVLTLKYSHVNFHLLFYAFSTLLALICFFYQIPNHVSFLHEEFLKLPAFPRKALEAEFTLYNGKGGEASPMFVWIIA